MTPPTEAMTAAQRPAEPPCDLRQRCRLPELMDDPQLDEQQHHAALQGLRRVNQISRSAGILWPSLRRMAASHGGQPLRVLDVGSGGGDVVVALARRAARAGLELQIDGCDVSQRAVDYAEQYAAEHSPAEHQFFVADALGNELPGQYDVIMCSLFLHHLSEDDGRQLLSRMAQACRSAVLVNDLRRTRFGYAMAVVGCRLLTRSPVVHVDGPLSVRAALSDHEALRLASEAGLAGAKLTRHWPQRFLLTWNKP
ncbi:MAG: methyltransferase domain-containing protein [Planctomycetales bacterium]|nr:methyltransferase domain-containing protein [Planctomycetales bacterium]